MSEIEWIVLVFLIAVGGWLLWRLRERAHRGQVAREQHRMELIDDALVKFADLHTEVASVACSARPRYEVVLADWGPDFTGYDGTLPRWRWAVLDADRAYKAALGFAPGLGIEETPFMLGNSFTSEDALLSAVEWIERAQHPQMPVVILGEVSPYVEDPEVAPWPA